MDWEYKLKDRDYNLLDLVGDGVDSQINPISLAAKTGTLQKALGEGYTIKEICRLATICQMIIYDISGGPDEDSQPKPLRRHWYSWFKTEFAQPFSHLLGQDIQGTAWGDRWSSYLSQTYANLVDNEDITYLDLWVKDGSRMIKHFWEGLFSGANIILCVEKDSLFEDFIAPAQALGAKCLYSGKGKSSKAAIEKVLRGVFSWSEDYDPFEDNPLYVLHISDFDYDGEAVIGPTFAEQCRRYTGNIIEARIGVDPQDLLEKGYELNENWYQVKLGRKVYREWAAKKAIKILRCEECEALFLSQKQSAECLTCGGVTLWYQPDENAFGYEVETMRTRDYHSLIVDALFRMIPLDELINRLREDCIADLELATDAITDEVVSNHIGYQELLSQARGLEERMEAYRTKIKNHFWNEGEGHASDWEGAEEDPGEDDFIRHVESSNQWTEAWKPFSTEERTTRMVTWFSEEFNDDIEEFLGEEV